MDKSLISCSLEGIRDRYLVELESRTHELVKLRAKVDDSVSSSEEAWDAIGFLAHKLAGTSATLGFQDLGDAASFLDEMILSGPEFKAEPSEVVKSIDELLSHMMAAQSTR